MPDNGERTTDTDILPAVDTLLGHNAGTLGQVPRETLALLLAASGAVADRLAELDRATSYASVLRPSWAALAALAPEAIGQQAEVSPEDTGSHTDPQTSGTVDNAGRYTAFGTEAGQWTWVDGGGLGSKLSISARLSEFSGPFANEVRGNIGAASQEDLDAAEAVIATKADAAAVTSALAEKADADAVAAALEEKAAVEDVVTRSGDQDVEGLKTFRDGVSTPKVGLQLGGEIELGAAGKVLVAGLDEVFEVTVDGTAVQVVWAVCDAEDRPAVALDSAGRLLISAAYLPEGATFRVAGSETSAPGGGWLWAVTDAAERLLIGVRENGRDVEFLSGQSSLEIWLETQNARNLATSARLTAPHNLRVARFDRDAGLILSVGQSLGLGAEGFPALNVEIVEGCVMIGQSVRPDYTDQTIWAPIGAAALTPLQATVDSTTVPRTVLSETEVQALVSGTDTNAGEAPVVGMTMGLARQFRRRGRVMPELCAMVANVGGRSLQQLSKGADPEIYNQIPTGIGQFVTLETAAGRSAEVSAVIFLQGENDYGAGTTKEAYRALLETYWTDIKAEITAQTGQAHPPVLFMYQTSAYGSISTPGPVDIGMAQWEFARAHDDVVMMGPVYPYPAKSVHLTANSYRQVGEKFAEVAARVLLEQRKFAPLSPLWTRRVGRTIYAGFHVPVPPLRFGGYYGWVNLITPESDPTKGFRVLDDGAELSVESVEIVSDTILAVTCAEAPSAAARLIAARPTFGSTALCDSGSYTADGDYVYDAGSGQAANENIVALVGQPYDQRNWSIGFDIAADSWSIAQ
ncbi:sialate O-acetylesterase [Salipiger manganoxidans]|uniref:sialate O-acetylesterase n=1 Tax=Salipiger marinus TaxID=555512 RepID=UPI001E292FBB|nr:sialate O-acetylesterase [Salipiger manganoxidans]MCD1621047.1 sialate O-acetylesterase [Salipiger manganoxidans]